MNIAEADKEETQPTFRYFNQLLEKRVGNLKEAGWRNVRKVKCRSRTLKFSDTCSMRFRIA